MPGGLAALSAQRKLSPSGYSPDYAELCCSPVVDVHPRCRRVAPPFGLPSAGFVAALQSPRALLGEIWTAIADRRMNQTLPSHNAVETIQETVCRSVFVSAVIASGRGAATLWDELEVSGWFVFSCSLGIAAVCVVW